MTPKPPTLAEIAEALRRQRQGLELSDRELWIVRGEWRDEE